MAKNLKINIKNTQIAEAINLGSLKSKLAKKKSDAKEESEKITSDKIVTNVEAPDSKEFKEDAPRIKARSRSAFAESSHEEQEKSMNEAEETTSLTKEIETDASVKVPHETVKRNVLLDYPSETEEVVVSNEAIAPKEPIAEVKAEVVEKPAHSVAVESAPIVPIPKKEIEAPMPPVLKPALTHPATPASTPTTAPTAAAAPAPALYPRKSTSSHQPLTMVDLPPREKLGPTGRHMRDLVPKKPVVVPVPPKGRDQPSDAREGNRPQSRAKATPDVPPKAPTPEEEAFDAKKGKGGLKAKEFRDIKPARKVEDQRSFDARDRQGLRASETDDESGYRRRRRGKPMKYQPEDVTIRPTELKIRVPIAIKDLASEMKLKASQLVAKLFLQGIMLTLNDVLDDETTIQLLGQEFGCNITIDTTEEKRIRITDHSIKEEILQSDQSELITRPPIVAFMGHVDHGKTSLIDAIRKSNRAAGEAGAITQHIGAFKCRTDVGDIAILDTPGHEAFSAMRARGADVTDIVVLVVAGDEGLRQQTIEAIQHAKAAKVTIVVAINKSDKPNFNAENVYRQLAEIDLLPEVWGGQTITVNCSAVTGEGVQALLEMLALQAEILELKANPNFRARGTVLESEMHKGLGSAATVLVQNGTLKLGDAVVFGLLWGRVKTMRDELGRELTQAGPSTPVEITGLSGMPEAGEIFIVVKNEREAREIAEVRMLGKRHTNLQVTKRQSVESLFQQASETQKKTLNIVLRADVQGSLEALKVALQKIESDKIDLNIIFAGVGEVSESDVQLAAASKAVVMGFHTQIESHADQLVKQMGVQVRMHDIIYHAIDDAKLLMSGLLDKIAQENEKGKAIVKATFRSSQVGTIAGCQVTEGTITRSNHIRVNRAGVIVWKGTISSLKRVKEDVREVQKGIECGILLNNFNDVMENDVLEAYEVTYITQEL